MRNKIRKERRITKMHYYECRKNLIKIRSTKLNWFGFIRLMLSFDTIHYLFRNHSKVTRLNSSACSMFTICPQLFTIDMVPCGSNFAIFFTSSINM
jgi:hypothetical protein